MSPRLTGLTALALALAVHAGLVLALVRPQDVKQEGAGQPQEATLGASFASLATPATPSDAAKPTLEAAKPEPPKALSATKATSAAQAAAPTPLKPVAAKPAAPSAAPSAVSAEPEAKPKPVVKPAPKPRATAKPTKKPAPAPKAKPAPRPVKKGSATGSRTSKAKPSGTPKKAPSKKAGNAAASNYPGRVNRHIAKRGRPSVGVKGRAVIRFTISANGRLASASVARSSGSTKLDSAALRLVRRAAPVPRPPAGAQRTFSIGIRSR